MLARGRVGAWVLALASGLALGSCALSHDVDTRTEVIGPDGFTSDVPFEVPEGARSITIVLDPFDDTDGFDTTLMGSMDLGMPVSERILVLTPEQRFAMTGSALLD